MFVKVEVYLTLTTEPRYFTRPLPLLQAHACTYFHISCIDRDLYTHQHNGASIMTVLRLHEMCR